MTIERECADFRDVTVRFVDGDKEVLACTYTLEELGRMSGSSVEIKILDVTAPVQAARDGVAAKSSAVDLHQDCTPWVADGECYRNPAFMLQQCKASCSRFASENDSILQDTSDTCVNFALTGGCTSNTEKATSVCRASCHIQRICGA